MQEHDCPVDADAHAAVGGMPYSMAVRKSSSVCLVSTQDEISVEPDPRAEHKNIDQDENDPDAQKNIARLRWELV